MLKKEFKVKKKDKLLNVIVSEGFSYNHACKLLRNKDVKVDGIRYRDNIDVMPEMVITVFYEDEKAITEKFSIVYQDENILIVNKGVGIEVEGRDGLEGRIKGSIAVHRLDRNTAGLLVMAKNKDAEQELIDAIKNHAITKKYLAEVVGATAFKGEKYKAYLEKDAKTSLVYVSEKASKRAKEIETIFKTIKSNPSSSIVECTLVTGRTHQIRAHLAYLGHPIIGDGKYGKNSDNKKFKEKVQKLFCCQLKLNGFKNNLKYLNNQTFNTTPNWLKK